MSLKSYLCFLFFFFCYINGAFSQPPPVIEWEQTYGGSGEDRAYAMEPTSDGGYIVAGLTDSNDGHVGQNQGGIDAWIIKLDANGNIVWEKSFGGSQDDRADDVRQTNDGGFIVSGSTYSNDGDVSQNHGGEDAWIFKLDTNGNLLWEQTYGGNGTDIIHAIQQTTDNGYILAGYTNSMNGDVTPNPNGGNLWVFKLDANGSLVWEKKYGGSGEEKAYGIKQTTDGGYIVGGYTTSADGDVTQNQGGKDVWVLKIDANGTLVWQKTYGGSNDDTISFDTSFVTGNDCIRQTSDGGYIMVGTTYSNNGDISQNSGIANIWVLKLNNQGNLDWEQTYGQVLNFGSSIQQSLDGNYIVAGTYSGNDNNGGDDFWLFKIGSMGNIIWEDFYGGSSNDLPMDVHQISGCEFIIIGRFASSIGTVISDYWVVKLQIPVSPPAATNPQIFCSGDNPVLGDLLATGQNLLWYDSATGGNLLALSTAIQDGLTYYVSQTIDACESDRSPVVVEILGQDPPIISSNTTGPLCPQMEATYNTDIGHSNYSWKVSGGTITSGGGSNDDSISVRWGLPGNYTVSVSHDLGNGCGQSQTASFPVTVEDCDISIEKTVDKTEVEIGEKVVFTIGATNLGNNDFKNVEINEKTPSGYSLINHTASKGFYDVTKGIWAIPLLKSGETEVLELCVEVLPQGEYLNTASLGSSVPADSNASNNSAQAATSPVENCFPVAMEGFSPDGDGLNDFFAIDCIEGHPQNKIRIFNRYGRLVFEVSGYDNREKAFRGISAEGNQLPTGTYFWVLDLNHPQYEVMKGWVYLNR